MEGYEIVFLAIDIALLGILLLTLLLGFIRGTIRTTIRSAITIGLVLFAFCIASLVTKHILEINNPFSLFEEDITVKEYISQVVAESILNLNMDKMVATGIDEVVYDISFSILRLGITIALSLIVLIIVAPLVKLIVLSILRVLSKKKPNLLGRFGGMIVGCLSYLILFSILVLPIFGAIEVTSKTIHQVATVNEEMAKVDEEINRYTENSITLQLTSHIGKTKTSNFGIGGKCFGKYVSIKTQNGKVNFIHDLDNMLPLISRIIDIYNQMESTADLNEKIDCITMDDIDLCISSIKDSELIRYAYPFVIQYLKVENDNIDIVKQLNLDYDVLMNIDFNQDIAYSTDFFKAVYQLLQTIDLTDLTNYEQYLTNDVCIEHISESLRLAMQISILKECFPKIAYYVLEDTCKESEYASIIQLITPEYLQKDFTNDLERVVDIYQILKEVGIIDYVNQVDKVYIYTDETEQKLINAKNCIQNIQLFQNHYPTILKEFAPKIKEILPLDIDQMVLEDVDWNQEMGVLLSVLIYGFEFTTTCDVDDNYQAVLENTKTPVCMKKMLIALQDSELAEKYYYPILLNYINEVVVGSFMEEYVDFITISYLKNDLVDDIDALFDIYYTATEMELFEMFEENNTICIDLSDETVKQKVENIFTTMLNLRLFVGHESVIFEKVYMSTDLNTYVPYKELDETIDWSKEKPYIVQVIMDIIDLGQDIEQIHIDISTLEEEKKVVDKFATLFDDMYDSLVTRPYVFELLDIIMENSGFHFEFTDKEKQDIMDCSMKVEMNLLFEVIKETKLVFGDNAIQGDIDTANLKGENVAYLMKKASGSIIASKVMGQVLNDALGENGLNINPIDVDTGMPKYDFTNPEILQNEADTIGKAIDLANAVNEVYKQVQSKGNLSTEQIHGLSQSIGNFYSQSGNSDITNDIMANICQNSDMVIDENIDWQNEASIMDKVLTTYQETENKDDFYVDENEELAQLVNDSTIAAALLQYLGMLN